MGSVVVASGTKEIYHNNDGRAILDASWSVGLTSVSTRVGSSDSWDLEPIPRYATVEQSLSSKTINSATINWSSDSIIDYVKYSIDNGVNWIDIGSVNSQNGSYIITGLNPNSTYSIKTQVRRKDSQLTTDSTALEVTTYDIGKLGAIDNFNHGNSININVSNPSGSTLKLAMSIGGVQIFNKTINTGDNTISFTDEALDNIYTQYGSSNTLTATFVLTTANLYTDTKTCTITLTGNQKVIKFGNSGIRRGKIFFGANGVRNAVIWIGDSNNVPRRGI